MLLPRSHAKFRRTYQDSGRCSPNEIQPRRWQSRLQTTSTCLTIESLVVLFLLQYELTEQELIDASSSVYHGIRDIRNSVLMNPVRSIFLVMGQQPQQRRPNTSLNCIFSSSTEDVSRATRPILKRTVPYEDFSY